REVEIVNARADRCLDERRAGVLERTRAIHHDGAADLLEPFGTRLLAVDMDIGELAVGMGSAQLALQRDHPRLRPPPETQAIAAASRQQPGEARTEHAAGTNDEDVHAHRTAPIGAGSSPMALNGLNNWPASAPACSRTRRPARLRNSAAARPPGPAPAIAMSRESTGRPKFPVCPARD